MLGTASRPAFKCQLFFVFKVAALEISPQSYHVGEKKYYPTIYEREKKAEFLFLILSYLPLSISQILPRSITYPTSLEFYGYEEFQIPSPMVGNSIRV